MSWRDRLRPGTFRGVPFEVESDFEAEVGRRTSTVEYPLRDTPFTKDLGRRARRWSLRCFVVGEDYDVARDALVRAFETAGPGQLVHPTWGELTVCVDGPVRVTEKGRQASFALSLVEAGTATYPSTSTAPSATVRTKSATAVLAAQARFATTFTTTAAPDWSVARVIEAVEAVVATLQDVRRRAGAVTARVAAAMSSLVQLVEDLGELVRDAVAFAERLVAAVVDSISPDAAVARADLAGIPTLPEDEAEETVVAAAATPRGRRALVGLDLVRAGRRVPEEPVPTPSGEQLEGNLAAIDELVQATAAAAAAEEAGSIAYETREEARTAQDALAEALYDVAVTTTDEVLYATLLDLRTTVVRALDTVTHRRVAAVTPPATLPALVLAYQLEGTALGELALTARNRFHHPGFVPGGQPVEVVVNV